MALTPPPAAPPLVAPFVLLDDARDGGAPALLYRDPVEVIVAHTPAEVAPALDRVRAAVTAGRHAAGFLCYGAGAAFEPSAGTAADASVPLVWFGLFDTRETVADVPALLPDPTGAWIGAPQPQVSRDDYEAMLGEVLALIAAGDIYQANLTFRADVPFAGDPRALYAAVRGRARAGWGAIVATGGETILSFSPELFFRLDGDALTCRPMKGTARRDPDPARDATIGRALAMDEKQRAENLMIVDLMRNDLSRVAAPGSVTVPALFAVESYPTVHQMTSTVTATIAPDRDAIDVLAALFPCGSVTGAPKVRAMQVIGAVERGAPRGVYCGAIGRIDAGGDAQFNVAIRTLAIHNGEHHATIGLGGGIVADSRADAEWDEAIAKGDFLTHGQRIVDLIETMAFDPEEGVLRLERHLGRMRDSAAALGFAFDRHDTRNELQAATFRLRAPARVRLLLARSGRIAIEVGAMPTRVEAMRVAVVPLPVAAHDYRLRHKCSDRGFYDAARIASGADEVVFVDRAGFVTEGSFTNVFVERDGLLLTPPLTRGLLPGVLRGDLIEAGRAIEHDLAPTDLAGGFFVGNALRGLIPALVAVAKSIAPPV